MDSSPFSLFSLAIGDSWIPNDPRFSISSLTPTECSVAVRITSIARVHLLLSNDGTTVQGIEEQN
jgi:hypothetical protein